MQPDPPDIAEFHSDGALFLTERGSVLLVVGRNALALNADEADALADALRELANTARTFRRSSDGDKDTSN